MKKFIRTNDSSKLRFFWCFLSNFVGPTINRKAGMSNFHAEIDPCLTKKHYLQKSDNFSIIPFGVKGFRNWGTVNFGFCLAWNSLKKFHKKKFKDFVSPETFPISQTPGQYSSLNHLFVRSFTRNQKKQFIIVLIKAICGVFSEMVEMAFSGILEWDVET